MTSHDNEQSITPQWGDITPDNELSPDFIVAYRNIAGYVDDVQKGKAQFDQFDHLTEFVVAQVELHYGESLDGTPATTEQRIRKVSGAAETINNNLSPDPNDPYTKESTRGYNAVTKYLHEHHVQYPKAKSKETATDVAKRFVHIRSHVRNNPPKPPQA